MDTGESALHFLDHDFSVFENRVTIGSFARAPARSKFGEILKKMVENHQKIEKIRFLRIFFNRIPGRRKSI